ncbi:hypothetical protein K438DRAFT_287286 [Mycena galopus ATCC 62051]|nr:hypothetical protein K438DRAFT_287286 [Mycena galopus ATCC 62051]
MKFQDLPEDIIRSIFSFCDIYRVLSMSRTNKYLRPLSLDRLVWVDLVASLWRKGFVDQLSLSDIQASSQEALVDLVKSLLTGPASWTGPVIPKSRWFRLARSPTCPIVQVGAKYAVHPPGVLPSNLKQPKLLNGGEYVLFNNVTLECWNVRRDELVWAYDRGGPEFQVAEFAAEVVDEGDSVNLIVCERSWTHSGNDQSLVQILKLDLTTGSSTPLLQKQNPDGKVYNFIDARISGDIACFVGTPWSFKYFSIY